MAYKAVDVARYMIDRAEQKKTPLSNLKLQKILYFVWKEYYAQKEEHLFEDYFFAWQFGPVVPDVYYDYFMFGASPIVAGLLEDFDDSIIEEKDKALIDEVLDKYAKESVFKLVNITHKAGAAWDRTYRNGIGNKEIISFEDIEEDVRNESGRKYNA